MVGSARLDLCNAITAVGIQANQEDVHDHSNQDADDKTVPFGDHLAPIRARPAASLIGVE